MGGDSLMSTWNTIKSSIAAVAPTLGASIGGPFGAAAGKMISKLLTGDAKAGPDKVYEALQNAAPETLLKLKKLDNDYKIKMEELGIDRQKLEQLDRSSARRREVRMAQSGYRDWTAPILAYGTTIGFFGVLISVFFIPIVHGMREVADVLIGALGTAWVTIVSYYFGSSFNAERSNKASL